MDRNKLNKMKTILTILFAAITFAATAQTIQKVDTVKNSIQVIPIVFNQMEKDTLYQLTIRAFDLSIGDSTNGCNTYVEFYDRKGKRLGAKNIAIPSYIVNKWGTDDTIIKDYVINFLSLFKRK